MRHLTNGAMMPQVKLLKMWKGYRPGTILNLTPGEIEILKQRGIAGKRSKANDEKEPTKDGNENSNGE
jgi:hypothetical protein